MPASQSGDDSEKSTDLNADFRDAVSVHLNRSLSFSDRQLIHLLLEQEILYHASGSGVNECIKLCCFMLFRLRNVEDSLFIWRAKVTTFDTFCGVDVQMLVGAGVEPTLAFLRGEGSPPALSAAEWIDGCRSTGDFSYMEQYRSSMDRYFAAE